MHLHIKSTKFKGNVNDDVIPQSLPFTHTLLNNIIIKKDWDDVEELIYDATQTPEFIVKYGKVNYDIERGVTGWKGKRGKEEDNPKKLKNKVSHDVKNDEDWKECVEEFGTKVKDPKKDKKIIIVDIGVAVYEKEKVVAPIKTRKRAPSTDTPDLGSLNSIKNKKKKMPDVFRAPKCILFEVMPPVDFNSKESVSKTSSTDPIGTFEIEHFDDYVSERYVQCENDRLSDLSSDSSNEEESVTTNLGVKEDEDDILCNHFIESIRHRLIYHILDNINGDFKAYDKKIGNKVFIETFITLLFNTILSNLPFFIFSTELHVWS